MGIHGGCRGDRRRRRSFGAGHLAVGARAPARAPGAFADAKRIAAEAVRIAARTDWLAEHGDALLAQAEVLQRADGPASAAAALREAIGLYERKENQISVRRACAMQVMDVPA